MSRPIHRLRDLDRRGRLVAAALAAGLVLVPLLAFVINQGRWVPQGDDALIGLRARDVGFVRMPLVGQPSTSGHYGTGGDNVAHPGAIEFYALAPGLRLLGPAKGMLATTTVVSAACLLVVAWVLYRRAGPRAGVAGAALGALAAATAGAAGMLDPLSSNAGRLPLLATAVLVWSLLDGDLRLAPLAAGAWTYTAQQHLSVLPAAAVVGAAGLLAIAGWLWVDRARWRSHLPWLLGALAVGAVLWAPVGWQQLTEDPGNLTALASYNSDDARRDLGLGSAASQVANVLGPRPLLGRSGVTGWDLTELLPAARVVATVTLLALVLGAGAWWLRRERGYVAAVAMVAVLVVAGLVTGANVPDSTEQGRLSFHHWAFSLSFFQLLALVWLGARLAEALLPRVTHRRPVTAVALAGVLVVGAALVPVVIDRPSDRLDQPVVTEAARELLDQVRAAPEVGPEGGPLLVLVNGSDAFVQIGDTVAADLLGHDVPAVFPSSARGFVHPSRIVEPCGAERYLVLSLHRLDGTDPPGTEVARVDSAPGLDRGALERLVATAESAHRVVLGPDLEGALASLPGDQGRFVGAQLVMRLDDPSGATFLTRRNLDLLIDHPIPEPMLDRTDLIALRDSLPDGTPAVVALEIGAHVLDRDDLRTWRPGLLDGC